MKLSAMALSATLALACASACVEHQPVPRAASTPREPTLLAGPARSGCDADALGRASLWAGTIVAREPMTLPPTGVRLVYDRVARCDRLEPDACRRWAEEEVSHVRIDGADALERRVEIGSEERGTMWSLLVDGQREGHLLRTNREFVRTFRELAAAGKHVEVTDRRRVTEPRFSRVHLRIAAPATLSIPAERWTLEFDASEMGVVEVGLALDDLATSGIVVSDRRELEQRGWQITPIASTAFLSTPLRDESKGRERAEVVVSCEGN